MSSKDKFPLGIDNSVEKDPKKPKAVKIEKEKQENNSLEIPKVEKLDFVSSFVDKKDEPKVRSRNKFFGLGAINADFVYLGVAAACLLGVILFYFQGLQPLVLKNYISTATQNLIAIKNSYSSGVEILNSLQGELFNEFVSTAPGQNCADTSKYEKLAEHAEKFDRLDVGLLPKNEYRSVKSNFNFYSPEADQIYVDFWSSYNSKLDEVKNEKEKLSPVSTYLNYMSSITQICTTFETTATFSPAVTKACDDLIKSFEVYDSTNTKPFFWDQVSALNQNVLDQCEKENRPVNNLTYFGWKIEWFGEYEILKQFTPSFSDISTRLFQLNSEFQDLIINTAKEFDELIIFRSEFVNLWYFLRIR